MYTCTEAYTGDKLQNANSSGHTHICAYIHMWIRIYIKITYTQTFTQTCTRPLATGNFKNEILTNRSFRKRTPTIGDCRNEFRTYKGFVKEFLLTYTYIRIHINTHTHMHIHNIFTGPWPCTSMCECLCIWDFDVYAYSYVYVWANICMPREIRI